MSRASVRQRYAHAFWAVPFSTKHVPLFQKQTARENIRFLGPRGTPISGHTSILLSIWAHPQRGAHSVFISTYLIYCIVLHCICFLLKPIPFKSTIESNCRIYLTKGASRCYKPKCGCRMIYFASESHIRPSITGCCMKQRDASA